MAKFVPKGPPRYAHQTRGLRKLIATNGVCALLFDPGLGKTMTTLDYMSVLALKKQPDENGVREVRVLVTAPLAAVDTWVDQAERYVHEGVAVWAEALSGSIRQRAEALAARGARPFKQQSRTRAKHGPRGIHYEKSVMIRTTHKREHGHDADGPESLRDDMPRLIIEVLNLDTFSNRLPAKAGSSTLISDVLIDAVERFSPDLLVVDESHRIKGVSSNVSRMMYRIGKRVPRRVLLTGTVMPSGPLDVYGQWRTLEPFAFGETLADGTKKEMTYDRFRNRYAELGGYRGQQVLRYKHLDELQNIMALNAEVARKADSLDLPATTDVKVRVDLSPAEIKAYTEMKKGLATTLAFGVGTTALNRLAQMMRLRQITAGYLPDDLGNLHLLGESKARTIASIAHDTLIGEKRIVVFALFRHEIAMLKGVLEVPPGDKTGRPKTEVMVVTGDTPASERLALRQRFGVSPEKDPTRMIMIAQVKTMSLAVNELVTASHAIFASLSQQRDDMIQARDRLNRIGQRNAMTFWYAMAPNTIDEVIYASHESRTNLEAAVLRHILGDYEAENAAADAERRAQDEQLEQVGRLITDHDGNVIERAYGEHRSDGVEPEDRRDVDGTLLESFDTEAAERCDLCKQAGHAVCSLEPGTQCPCCLDTMERQGL